MTLLIISISLSFSGQWSLNHTFSSKAFLDLIYDTFVEYKKLTGLQ